MIKIIKIAHDEIEAIFYMKKILIFFIFIVLSYTYVGNALASHDLLPEDALRMRVIANSDSSYDQYVKMKVKEEVEKDMFELLKSTKDTEKAKEQVKNNLPMIESKVNQVLLKENYPLGYHVNYGKNYFPEKKYKGITYKEGYYESLVITLGKGKGENFWCVMFPPLCMMETDNLDQIEYKSLVKEIIDKYVK